MLTLFTRGLTQSVCCLHVQGGLWTARQALDSALQEPLLVYSKGVATFKENIEFSLSASTDFQINLNHT